MENKLQQLTQKLYEEGLSKGRSDADKLVGEAQERAKKIVTEARQQADAIVSDAKKSAEELKRNAMTELSLAGRQSIAALKENINRLIVAKSVSGSVHAVSIDPEFIGKLLLAVAKNWNGSDTEKVSLSALLPASMKEDFEGKFEASVKTILAEGIEVGYSESVKSGFRIGPKEGGYYISFTDEDFDALLGEYLKGKVAEILYSE